MTNLFKKTALVATVAGLALTAAPAFAAPTTAVDTSATASVRLYNPLEVQKATDLNFGTVYRESAYADAVFPIAADGTVTCQANAVCSGATTAGEFLVAGHTDAVVTFSLGGTDYDAATNQLTLRSGDTVANPGTIIASLDLEITDAALTLTQPTNNGWELDATQGSDPDNAIGATGSTDVPVSVFVTGSVAIPAALASDRYSADFTLTADYK